MATLKSDRPSFLGDFKEVFRYIDKDGDGKISIAELKKIVGHGELPSPTDVEALMESLEFDKDGLLEFEKLAKLVEVEEEEEEERRKELREAFGMFSNTEMEGGEGCCITAKSLKRMLSRLGMSKNEEDCRAMISSFDLNGDGVLCFEEFMVMMQ